MFIIDVNISAKWSANCVNTRFVFHRCESLTYERFEKVIARNAFTPKRYFCHQVFWIVRLTLLVNAKTFSRPFILTSILISVKCTTSQTKHAINKPNDCVTAIVNSTVQVERENEISIDLFITVSRTNYLDLLWFFTTLWNVNASTGAKCVGR